MLEHMTFLIFSDMFCQLSSDAAALVPFGLTSFIFRCDLEGWSYFLTRRHEALYQKIQE